MSGSADHFNGWLAALEARHLAELRVAEVTRALRALSSAYVQRREGLPRGAPLQTAGKRAAFALVFAPLHFLVTRHIVRALPVPRLRSILDLGCGTGAAGAAWSLEAAGQVEGLDRHPWAVEEARWTYRQLAIPGRARQADVMQVRLPARGSGILAAYVLNELPDAAREALVGRLLDAARRGATVLILEPIARRITPWWDDTRRRVERCGGRADEWAIALDLPPLIAMFDRAAGLDHRQVKARSLLVG